MFLQTWKKYVPVIVLLMKRSSKADQVLDMNHTDFERAAGGKKIKLAFSELQVGNGGVNYGQKQSVLATDLSQALLENEKSEVLIREQLFEFSMNSSFQLIIKNITPALSSGIDNS